MKTRIRAPWFGVLPAHLLAVVIGTPRVALAQGASAPATGAPGERAGSTQEPQALVVTLSGRLGVPELARCHRVLRDAEARGISYVVFRCDLDTGSQTEDPDALQSLFDHIQSTPVGTVTLIRGRATQGAAYLALVTSKTFCMPGVELARSPNRIRNGMSCSPTPRRRRATSACARCARRCNCGSIAVR